MTYQPYFEFGTKRAGRWTVTSDHAANTVPDFVNGGDLGIGRAHMDRHIAYDIGAMGVARRLGELLDGPVIGSNFSRLVIDPNRGLDDPTLLMKLYDGTIIPANRYAGAAELKERLDNCYHPYHRALDALMTRCADPVLLSIHSFTPQLQGRPKRPWEIGVLYAQDDRLARPLMEVLNGEPEVRDEKPDGSATVYDLKSSGIDAEALTGIAKEYQEKTKNGHDRKSKQSKTSYAERWHRNGFLDVQD